MPVNSLPINTPSLRLRHIVVEEAARMMELNGEPSTRRWLPSHVYADANAATSRMQYLISCYSSPAIRAYAQSSWLSNTPPAESFLAT